MKASRVCPRDSMTTNVRHTTDKKNKSQENEEEDVWVSKGQTVVLFPTKSRSKAHARRDVISGRQSFRRTEWLCMYTCLAPAAGGREEIWKGLTRTRCLYTLQNRMERPIPPPKRKRKGRASRSFVLAVRKKGNSVHKRNGRVVNPRTNSEFQR